MIIAAEGLWRLPAANDAAGVFLIGAVLLLAFPMTALLTFELLGGWILIVFGIVILIAWILGLRAAMKLSLNPPVA